MTREKLMRALIRYERAIRAMNDDRSVESMLELDAAREAFMDVLLEAKTNISE